LLLERRDVDPGAIDNEAIRFASFRGHTEIVRLLLSRPDVNPSAIDNEAIRFAYGIGNTDIIRMLEQDERVKAIDFLMNNRDGLKIKTFIYLFDSQLKLDTLSYIENVFANDLVASFISNFLNIPLEDARAINNLEEFDRQLLRLHRELDNNLNTLLSQKKFEFLFRYYSATLGFRDHFGRFQDILAIQLKNYRARN